MKVRPAARSIVLTPRMAATPPASRPALHRPSPISSHLRKSKYIYFSEHYDGGSAVSQVDPATGQIERLWKGDETIFTMDGGGVSLSDDGKSTAVARNSWQRRARSVDRPGRRLAQADACQRRPAAPVGRIEKPALEERRVHCARLADLPARISTRPRSIRWSSASTAARRPR